MEVLGYQLTFSSAIGILKLLLSIVVFVGVNQYMSARPRPGADAPRGYLAREKYLYRQSTKTTRAFFVMSAACVALIVILEVVF